MTKPNVPPTRAQLIRQLEATTKTLKQDGAAAERMAPVLAARGWPAGTLGDGGARGTGGIDADGEPLPAQSDSTANAAAQRDRWAGSDEKLARLYLALYELCGGGQRLVTDLAAHAQSDAEHEGEHLARTNTNGAWCLACERWVAGTANDRIRSGFCKACNMAWRRLVEADPFADRAAFIRQRPKHDAETEPERIDPTDAATVVSSALALDIDRATADSQDAVESTRWDHGATSETDDVPG